MADALDTEARMPLLTWLRESGRVLLVGRPRHRSLPGSATYTIQGETRPAGGHDRAAFIPESYLAGATEKDRRDVSVHIEPPEGGVVPLAEPRLITTEAQIWRATPWDRWFSSGIDVAAEVAAVDKALAEEGDAADDDGLSEPMLKILRTVEYNTGGAQRDTVARRTIHSIVSGWKYGPDPAEVEEGLDALVNMGALAESESGRLAIAERSFLPAWLA